MQIDNVTLKIGQTVFLAVMGPMRTNYKPVEIADLNEHVKAVKVLVCVSKKTGRFKGRWVPLADIALKDENLCKSET